MVWRTLIGLHPTGHVGLFVSKPGLDATASDPTDRSAWMFSSAIDKQANILQAGRCNLNDTVTLPDLGAVPMVMFDQYNPSTGQTFEVMTISNGDGNYTMFRVTHLNTYQFQIIPQVSSDKQPSGFVFRYIAFTLAQDG